MNKKRVFIIIVVLILIVLTVVFLRKRKSAQEEGRSYGFREFFTFSKKVTGDPNAPGAEQGGEFTPNENTETPTPPGQEETPTKTAFGTNQPFSPIDSVGGNNAQGGTNPINGGVSGGTIDDDPNGGDPRDIKPPTLPLDDSPGGPLCSADDLEIEFTAEEIARLKELESRFYLLAPTLRSDQDVAVERGNWSSYVFLNEKFADMTNYCEDNTPGLPADMRHYVRTPFWSDSKSGSSFVDSTDGGLDINLDKPSDKRTGYIERFFKLNIW